MEQGCSAADFRRLLERLDRLEAQVTAQQATIAEQQRIIVEQRATIAAQHEALETAREQITLLKKALFAPKRERFTASPDQTLLFESPPSEPTAPAVLPPEPLAAKQPRRQRRKFTFPAFLPVVRHEHPLPPEELACGCCGCSRNRINTLVTRQIELERAKAFIEEHVRYTYACPQCRDGGQMITTSKPPAPLVRVRFVGLPAC